MKCPKCGKEMEKGELACSSRAWFRPKPDKWWNGAGYYSKGVVKLIDFWGRSKLKDSFICKDCKIIYTEYKE